METKYDNSSKQFARHFQFFGEKGQFSIRDAFVVVIGVGGVGSNAAHSLVRSGLGKIRVLDFDGVSESSLNRHAIATREDIGQPKAEVLKKHFKNINPWCEVEAINEMLTEDNVAGHLTGNPDFVLDCIDNIPTKTSLIQHCIANNIPIMSSMGAGAKCDPTRMLIGDISDVSNDPLASKLRYSLRKLDPPIHSGLTVIYSNAKPAVGLMSPEASRASGESAPDCGVEGVRMRSRILPVLGPMPVLFGTAMASHVLCQLGEMSYEPAPIPTMSKTVVNKLLSNLVKRETEIAKAQGVERPPIQIRHLDVEHIIQTIWKGRSAITEERIGGGGVSKFLLVRWDPQQPVVPENIVLVMKDELDMMNEENQWVICNELSDKINITLAKYSDWLNVEE